MEFLNPFFLSTINSPFVCSIASGIIPSFSTIFSAVLVFFISNYFHNKERNENLELDTLIKEQNEDIKQNFVLLKKELLALRDDFNKLHKKVNFEKVEVSFDGNIEKANRNSVSTELAMSVN